MLRRGSSRRRNRENEQQGSGGETESHRRVVSLEPRRARRTRKNARWACRLYFVALRDPSRRKAAASILRVLPGVHREIQPPASREHVRPGRVERAADVTAEAEVAPGVSSRPCCQTGNSAEPGFPSAGRWWWERAVVEIGMPPYAWSARSAAFGPLTSSGIRKPPAETMVAHTPDHKRGVIV